MTQNDKLNILVVENEPKEIQALKRFLGEIKGHNVVVVTTGQAALEKLNNASFDAVVLDHELDSVNGVYVHGLEVIRRIRANGNLIPVVFVSMFPDTKGSAFDALTHAYHGKPYDVETVYQQIEALVRLHRHANKGAGDLLVSNTVVLDAARREIKVGGVNITLTRTPFDILRYLMQRAPHVISKGEILRQVRPPVSEEVDEQVVETHIAVIRAALKKARPKADEAIQTVRGIGYKFTETVERKS